MEGGGDNEELWLEKTEPAEVGVGEGVRRARDPLGDEGE